MIHQPYQPGHVISGPAYSLWFKLLATIVTIGLAGYGISIAMRFPLMQFGLGVKLLLLVAALMLAISYYWFLNSRTTIDEHGIQQTWLYNKKVSWADIRSVKLLGVPYAGWLFPPRLVVRTGNSFMTFNGGTHALLAEFARIVLTYQAKR